jgi:hypothetical protein
MSHNHRYPARTGHNQSQQHSNARVGMGHASHHHQNSQGHPHRRLGVYASHQGTARNNSTRISLGSMQSRYPTEMMNDRVGRNWPGLQRSYPIYRAAIGRPLAISGQPTVGSGLGTHNMVRNTGMFSNPTMMGTTRSHIMNRGNFHRGMLAGNGNTRHRYFEADSEEESESSDDSDDGVSGLMARLFLSRRLR